MKAHQVLLDPMYDSEPDLANYLDKITRGRIIEYVENIEVELAWNYGAEIAAGLSVAVFPVEMMEISNKMPVATFSLRALLCEWAENVLEDLEPEQFDTYRAILSDAKRGIDRIIERAERIFARKTQNEARDTKVEAILAERHPELTYSSFHQARGAAVAAIKAELGPIEDMDAAFEHAIGRESK